MKTFLVEIEVEWTEEIQAETAEQAEEIAHTLARRRIGGSHDHINTNAYEED